MPRSAAWQRFQSSRKESAELLVAAAAADDSLGPGVRLSLRERQLRLFVVSLIGSLQAYIAELLEEICDHLPDDWNALTLIQRRYVCTHIHRRSSNLIQEYPEAAFHEDKKVEQFIKQVSECVNWYSHPSSLSASVLKADLEGFLGDNGSKALDRALTMHRPDAMRFSDWLGAQKAHRSSMEILDNAIRLRNEAAHGKIAQRITVEDARRYRVIVTRIVQKADEYVAI
jgi:hypothetical protein